MKIEFFGLLLTMQVQYTTIEKKQKTKNNKQQKPKKTTQTFCGYFFLSCTLLIYFSICTFVYIYNNTMIRNYLGFSQPGGFEMLPHEMMMNEYNVLFFGPIYVTRILLPLIHGRRIASSNKNGNYNDNNNNNNSNNSTVMKGNYLYTCGGRIINVSSQFRMMPFCGVTRYGTSKAGISYLSHCLRAEYASTFGIWSCSVEPGGYKTQLMNRNINVFHKKLLKYYYDMDENENENENELRLKQSLSDQEKEMCQTFKLDKFLKKSAKASAKMERQAFGDDYSDVVDDIIHGVTAKYPRRDYQPGHCNSIGAFVYSRAPQMIKDVIMFQYSKRWLAV